MAISILCPECRSRLKIADDRAGEEIECPRCGATFTAPAAQAPARRKATAVDEDDQPERKPKPKSQKAESASRRRFRDEDDDEEEEEEERTRKPRRSKRQREEPESHTMVFVLIGVAALIFAVGAIAAIWAMTSKKPETASSSTTPSAPATPAGPPAGPAAPPNPPPKEKSRSNNAGKIEGTKWSSIAGVIKGKFIPAGTLKLDFAANGKLVYTTPNGILTGTYSLGLGDMVVLNLDQALVGKRQHEETVVINGNQLTMTDSDGTSLSFEKVW